MFLRLLTWLMVFSLGVVPWAWAENVDAYVSHYLHVREPISLAKDAAGHLQEFTPEDISRGKSAFEGSCKTCHVGGATLPNPLVSLALADLQGATPPRDNIDALVAYIRAPRTYDGTEVMDWCRQVPPSWMNQQQAENLAAFVLTAAQKAPGWGSKSF